MKDGDFGVFLHNERMKRGISIRQLAERLDCSPGYVSSVEKGRRNPFQKDRLMALARIFDMSKDEEEEMLTIAGMSKNVKSDDHIPVDLSGYVRNNYFVSAALRTARDLNASEQEWNEFVIRLKERTEHD